MRASDFHFDLPESLIAQQPLANRRDSRLLMLDGATGQVSDGRFTDVLDLLQPDDLLVFNNTRVIPARLLGKKASGGQVEVLVERLLDDHHALAHVRASKSPKPGSYLMLEEQVSVEVTGRDGALFALRFDEQRIIIDWLHEYGHMPLPPYIQRPDNDNDQSRYQTVFSKHPGAVAAPTAGLHFDQSLLEAIRKKGVHTAEVTLHVGAGTFQPVRVDKVEEHVMHAEWLDVSQSVVDAVTACRERGGRVVAVGTTVVRSLETAARSGELQPFQGDTRLFITPGYRFQVVDALVTNFHLPESTLLMLVSAFAGQEAILSAYRHAVAQQYRFFSYGDAMWMTPQAGARA